MYCDLWSYVPWPLVLCTVTFGFPNPKKNSFRGNYMRKYGKQTIHFHVNKKNESIPKFSPLQIETYILTKTLISYKVTLFWIDSKILSFGSVCCRIEPPKPRHWDCLQSLPAYKACSWPIIPFRSGSASVWTKKILHNGVKSFLKEYSYFCVFGRISTKVFSW